MKSLAALTLLLSVAATPVFADPSWFEGRWIWDEDASIESITQGHQYLLACNTHQSVDGASATECMTLREKLGGLMEGVRGHEWLFDAETATRLNDGVAQRFAYSAYPIDEGSFELQLTVDEVQVSSIVQKTETGFCMAPSGGDRPAESGPTFVDCYERSSNGQLDVDTIPSPKDLPIMKVALMYDDEIVVDGVATGIAQFERALAALKAAHGSVIYYRAAADAQPTAVELDVLRAFSGSHVVVSISTEPDFSTVQRPDGTVGNQE